MTQANETNPKRDALSALAIALFLAALALPLAQMLVPVFPERPNTENRALAAAPGLGPLSRHGLQRFQQGLVAYFNDHYGFKGWLVRWDALANHKLFGLGINRAVLIGQDGWLFFQGAPHDGESDLAGAPLFTAQELDQIRSRLLSLDRALAARHAAFVVVLAPDKESIYPECLPMGASPRIGARADQVARALAGSGLAWVDLRGPLRAAKERFKMPLYYKTDTHWNPLGAYLGSRVIQQRVRQLLPRLGPADPVTPRILAQANHGHGDLAALQGLSGALQDWDLSITPTATPAAISLPAPYANPKNPLMANILMAVPGSRAPRALVYRDSFCGFLVPTLSERFSRALYLWQNRVDLETVDLERPDVVILEFVERNIRQLLNPAQGQGV